MKHYRWISVSLLIVLVSSSGVTATIEPTSSRRVTEWSLSYFNAHRVIQLADGSRVILVNRPAPNEPIAVNGVFVSVKGRSYDTILSVAKWIPKRLAEGTQGQLYSVSMSDDHQLLAATGGWRDEKGRGHNGIFILKRQQQNEFDYWRLIHWFDVRGLTIGEVEFGPGETILATSHAQAGPGYGFMLTAFTFDGENLGFFIKSDRHEPVSSARFARLMRIQRASAGTYFVYDPENRLIRHIDVAATKGGVRIDETEPVALPPDQSPASLLAFDIRPDGRIAVVNTFVENRHGRTVVSLLDRNGRMSEQWQSPRVWQYAFVHNGRLFGFYQTSAGEPVMTEQSVDIKSASNGIH